MSTKSVNTAACYSAQSLAARLNVSVNTIKIWVKEGKLPVPFPFSTRLRWDVAAFEKWLATQQEGGTHE